MLRGLFKSLLESSKIDVAKRYQVLQKAVSGTMSDFVMARDRETGEIVGLKVLDKLKTEQLEARFKGLNKPCEGAIAMQMDHPLVVKTFAHGMTTKGEQYVVMEFLDGPGLNSLLIARSPLLDGNRVALMREAAEALAYVHGKGFIHRDVCPRNLVCSKDCKSLKLIDFGLTVPNEKPYLQPGNRTGTPNYMAPEIVRRRPTDHRLDIFAFGASMYELFTFELPWARGTDGLAAMTHGTGKIPPIATYRPKVSPALDAAICKCMAAEPADRFPSMETFLNAIRQVKQEDVG
ncbi:Serine/threonine-protein kinase PknB [Pirellulimonas nuda]|uniref:Serine/threonine-protein kinase PknB n=1 Tax=Pirellulimonas nuda TaxID=2528009 RepID=A0A518DIE0_9BACT|nr:serine/threonine-protein kinase [Pirellulimonas nuda]QDU91247.1 Serine/threonine-protein kinase PknB [Pirellulimonas nuda]